ncbi:hypothetical protein M422DRAFT_242208 [Sphaerobolus stellatus SS14]|nr:hypothetical protein M422DRAFT_242208 [Sphaerobolus stellatus SS14]
MEKEYSTQVFLIVGEEIRTEATRHTVKLQVMLSRWHPVAVILGFHSMGAMNFFTPIHVVSLYAHATLDERHSLVLYRVTDRETCASRDLKKYCNRGFDLVLSGKDELGCDRWSWVKRLNITGFPEEHLRLAEVHDEHLFAMQWQLKTSEDVRTLQPINPALLEAASFAAHYFNSTGYLSA